MSQQHSTFWEFPRVAGVAAIVFAILIVAINLALVPAGMPNIGADPGAAARFFDTNSAATGLTAMALPTAWIAAILFAAGAATVLPGAKTSGWMWTGFAGVILQNATFTAVIAIRIALAADAPAGLWLLHDALFGLNGTFLAAALFGFSIAGRRAGLIRGWHATLGLAAAVLQFISASLTPLVMAEPEPLGSIGLIGWLMWVAWLIAYGTALLRTQIPQPEPRTRTGAPKD